MLHIYMPSTYDGTSPIPFVEDFNEVAALIGAGKPVLFNERGTRMLYHAVHICRGAVMTLNKVQRVPSAKGGGYSEIVKWRIEEEGRTYAWGGEMKLRTNHASRSGQAEPELMRQSMAKALIHIDKTQLEKDIEMLGAALRHITTKEAAKSANIGCGRSTLYLVPKIERFLHEAIARSAQDHRSSAEAKSHADSARKALMSSLPDGTPLIITHPKDRTWQLGLKKGTVDLSTARNALIPSSATLLGSDLKSAGMSAHDILPLLAKSEAAAKEYPGATTLADGSTMEKSNFRLHAGSHLHESFLSEKRQATPVAWIGTQNPGKFPGHFDIVGDHEPLWRHGRFRETGTKPPYNPSSGSVLRYKQTKEFLYPKVPLHPFARLGALWVVNTEVKELLQAHKLAGITFTPVEIEDIHGNLNTDYHYISTNLFIECLVLALCDPNAVEIVGGRHIKPYEFVVKPEIPEEFDMWFDETVRNCSMFFSDRLYRALKKIKAFPRIAPKPCA